MPTKKWYEENKEKAKEYQRKYRLENLERVKEKDRKWREANKGKRKTYANKNTNKETIKKWRLENKERIREYDKQYRKENREQANINWQNYKTRKINNGGKLSKQDWNDVLEKYGNKCLCCGRTDLKLTIDHVVPVKHGGRTEKENVQPLCKSCNSKKHDRHIDFRISN